MGHAVYSSQSGSDLGHAKLRADSEPMSTASTSVVWRCTRRVANLVDLGNAAMESDIQGLSSGCDRALQRTLPAQEGTWDLEWDTRCGGLGTCGTSPWCARELTSSKNGRIQGLPIPPSYHSGGYRGGDARRTRLGLETNLGGKRGFR